MRTKKTETIQFKISFEDKERLRKMAEEKNTSVTALIEEGLRLILGGEDDLESRVQVLEREIETLKSSRRSS